MLMLADLKHIWFGSPGLGTVTQMRGELKGGDLFGGRDGQCRACVSKDWPA